LIVFKANGGTRLFESELSEEVTKEEAFFGRISKADVLCFHAASGDTLALRSSIREDWRGVFANADVVSCLATTVNVNTICSVNINIQYWALFCEVADTVSWCRAEEGKYPNGFV
jgi:hypothetical protein